MSGSIRLTDRSESSFVFRWQLNCAAVKAFLIWTRRRRRPLPPLHQLHREFTEICRCHEETSCCLNSLFTENKRSRSWLLTFTESRLNLVSAVCRTGWFMSQNQDILAAEKTSSDGNWNINLCCCYIILESPEFVVWWPSLKNMKWEFISSSLKSLCLAGIMFTMAQSIGR